MVGRLIENKGKLILGLVITIPVCINYIMHKLLHIVTTTANSCKIVHCNR